MLNIRYEKTATPKELPAKNDPLKFGTIFTDHMFVMDYETVKGWHDARIIPYQPISLDPSAMVFHYGQEMFEGLKAYKTEDGRVLLFRPNKNIERANNTNRRICIPEIPEEDFLQAIKEVVKTDEAWIPTKPGTSLYIRPFIIATDPFLGVRPSDTYKFIIILSPVGAYYPEGLDPVKIWIEDEYVRAVKGGIGEAKTGANYVASLKSQVKAHEEGYSQVLWLDGVNRKYIEEVGAMNIFFKIDGKIVTPVLNGSILPGVTRDSVICLCKEWGLPVEERKIDIAEIKKAYEDGTLEEVFGSGTAAVISPVGQLRWEDTIMQVRDGGIGEYSQKLYDTITGIQLGKEKDILGWTVEV
ncbi:branched-chain amino acid aminotransferase [Anaerocolumna xylanovorans]|uniref:Branched-chain-amino-acid aminotransferase n=1 Tax=Anaerocolumna xylanovorans DSM 12503 TaxID=1121345 RepID=A0A1M7YDV4_9FIRM|nr:branched-chain amino acid aminotransferase [Anaerocolumna xylanovorans]SHO50817.1 branched chain amino acid aminotransferase apoenzyme [Anaerocolumna xylanovorans DSM 12503]